ncbi:hypothetical protein NDU88_005039 [Pleurodeles waltl]|uniref:Uncharacterized protein n=1 Tax=Pleurodeles waltl TaxID=8319 RepID=A0AAV7NMR8_PLEWA|nr:hypothetical protein NDU88_005039 [Pleurodeles waltl]
MQLSVTYWKSECFAQTLVVYKSVASWSSKQTLRPKLMYKAKARDHRELEGPERKPNRGPEHENRARTWRAIQKALKRGLPGTSDNTGDRAAKKKETRRNNREDCYDEEEAERDSSGPSSAESAEIHLGRSNTVTRPSSIQGVNGDPNGAKQGPARNRLHPRQHRDGNRSGSDATLRCTSWQQHPGYTNSRPRQHREGSALGATRPSGAQGGTPPDSNSPPLPPLGQDQRVTRTSALPGEDAARQSSVVVEPTRTCSGSAPGRLKATPNAGSRRSAQQKGPSRRRDVGQLYSTSGKPHSALSRRQPSHAVTLGDPRSKKHFGGSPRPPRTVRRTTPIAETDTQSGSTGRSERGQQNRNAGPPGTPQKLILKPGGHKQHTSC